MTSSMKTLAVVVAAALLVALPAGADVKKGVAAWSRGDYPAAVREWQPLADQGDADARFNLAQAYYLGRGVAQDRAKAEALYQKAAAQGHVQAASFLGLMLFQDGERRRAMPYLLKASDYGDARAQYVVGLAYFNADLAPKDWVRAYALVSLSKQAGLPQAADALAKMDTVVPLEQRQQGLALADKLANEAKAKREGAAPR